MSKFVLNHNTIIIDGKDRSADVMSVTVKFIDQPPITYEMSRLARILESLTKLSESTGNSRTV